MSYLIKFFIEKYRYVMSESIDKRVSNWFLMSSIIPIVCIQLFYLYIVFKFGPEFMKNRKAFKLKKLLISYNFLQVILNLYITFKIACVVFTKFKFGCNRRDYSFDPHAIALAEAQWLYFVTKIVDLLDTVFFILKKKDKQITFLHVYHHCGMVFFAWLLAKFFGSGQILFIAFFNSFVHIWMYTYYMLTAIDKKHSKNLWWKKHLTELQLAQFFCGFCVQVHVLFSTDCDYPLLTLLISLPQNFFFFALFGDFYIKEYIKGKK